LSQIVGAANAVSRLSNFRDTGYADATDEDQNASNEREFDDRSHRYLPLYATRLGVLL
jgi:hypothetical protein